MATLTKDNRMILICVAGQMRTGKNVTGEYLSSKLGLSPSAFAVPVKKIFCDAFGVDLEFVEKWKTEKQPPPGFTKTVRQTLQFIGDGFRQIRPEIWLEYALRSNNKNSCYMDGRYINELKAIQSAGGVTILLWRKGYENDDPNGSEAQIKPIVDWFVKTGLEGAVHLQLERKCSSPKWWLWLHGCLLRLSGGGFGLPMHHLSKTGQMPAGAEHVDLFIRNEGSLEELQKKCDDLILPYLKGRGEVEELLNEMKN